MFPRVGIRGHLKVNSGHTKIRPDSYCRFSSSVRGSRLPLVPLLSARTSSFRDVGEYLRDEVTFTPLPSTSSSFNSLSGHIILIGAKVRVLCGGVGALQATVTKIEFLVPLRNEGNNATACRS